MDDVDTQDIEQKEKKDREVLAKSIKELKNTYYWKSIIKPQFDLRLAMLDANMRSEADPWKRYGLVDAYTHMAEFRMWFDDKAEEI